MSVGVRDQQTAEPVSQHFFEILVTKYMKKYREKMEFFKGFVHQRWTTRGEPRKGGLSAQNIKNSWCLSNTVWHGQQMVQKDSNLIYKKKGAETITESHK